MNFTGWSVATRLFCGTLIVASSDHARRSRRATSFSAPGSVSPPTLQPGLRHRQPEEEQRKADEHKEDAQHQHEAGDPDRGTDPHEDGPLQEVWNLQFRTRFLADALLGQHGSVLSRLDAA